MTTVVAIVVLVGINLPAIIGMTVKFCLEGDAGYVWVINMLTGIVAYVIIKANVKNKGWARVAGVVVAIIAVILAECFIWHTKEAYAIISSRITSENIAYTIVGLVSATIGFFIHTFGWDYGDGNSSK